MDVKNSFRVAAFTTGICGDAATLCAPCFKKVTAWEKSGDDGETLAFAAARVLDEVCAAMNGRCELRPSECESQDGHMML